MSHEFLVCEVDGVALGVAAAEVQEVLRAAALFPLPEHQAVVEGGLNLRGTIVPVVGGRAALGRSAKPLELSDHLIVLRRHPAPIALRVDRAVEFTRAPAADLAAGDGKLVRGIVHSQRGPISVLDVDRLAALADPASAPPVEEDIR